MLILSFLVVYQSYDIKQKKIKKRKWWFHKDLVWSWSELIKLVYDSEVLIGRSERWHFVSAFFGFRCCHGQICHVFTKIFGMLKRRIIGSIKTWVFAYFSNIFEGNSRVVFTQFRLFRWHFNIRFDHYRYIVCL